MLGWKICIHRHVPEPYSLTTRLTNETVIATWVVGLGGLDWLNELVKGGKAEDFCCGVYPDVYLVKAKNLLPKLSSVPPRKKGPLVIGDDHILPGGWIGEVKIDQAKRAECLPEEQLVIEAWDQS